MAKSADAADLKSAALNSAWGFKSPSGHHIPKDLLSGTDYFRPGIEIAGACFDACWTFLFLQPVLDVCFRHERAFRSTTDWVCSGDK
jgi:hypothetical protein